MHFSHKSTLILVKRWRWCGKTFLCMCLFQYWIFITFPHKKGTTQFWFWFSARYNLIKNVLNIKFNFAITKSAEISNMFLGIVQVLSPPHYIDSLSVGDRRWHSVVTGAGSNVASSFRYWIRTWVTMIYYLINTWIICPVLSLCCGLYRAYYVELWSFDGLFVIKSLRCCYWEIYLFSYYVCVSLAYSFGFVRV